MLDDSNDPTPLLKEIRDDKTATIIVDANATMSHVILERVSMVHLIAVLFMHCFHLSFVIALQEIPRLHIDLTLAHLK